MATFNPSSFVVLGEGLAAGLCDFSLNADAQLDCFAAHMALQLGTALRQRLIQPPGLGYAAGFGGVPVIVPSPLQSTVLEAIPPEPSNNLSVPGFTMSDAVRLRPSPPLIQRDNPKQTAANILLGIDEIAYGRPAPCKTQLERAVALHPTLAVVALGFVDVFEAVTADPPRPLPDAAGFRRDCSTIVRTLRAAGADVIVLTIPDPLHTAYYSDLSTAARLVKVAPPLLQSLWSVASDEMVTATGLHEMAFQLFGASVGPERSSFRALPKHATLERAAARSLTAVVEALNGEIAQIAEAHGAMLYDLHAFVRQVHDRGVDAGGRRLSAEYLGGFYSLNGYCPGGTGHALIANELLALLECSYGNSLSRVDVSAVCARDPVASYEQAAGPEWTLSQLTLPQPLPPPAPPASSQRAAASPISYSPATVPAFSTSGHILKLPPGLEQVLPVDTASSYFGDAISAQHCRRPETVKYGTGGNLYFGGLAMMDSHLSGSIRITFSPPEGDVSTFELVFEGTLVGDDSVLEAPILFKMPGKQQRVGNIGRVTARGRLNLRTGDVETTPSPVTLYAGFFNSALFALLRVNPTFPTDPLSFPGPYGSSEIAFQPRDDGLLDVVFVGSTFVPLGENARFPLSFVGPSRQFASIPGAGTVLHPHLCFTTRPSHKVSGHTVTSEIPFNTVQEFTLFSAASSFGDVFTLGTRVFGGPALGRSRLFGRVQVQFGPRSGTSVPIAVSTSVASGLLAPLERTPLSGLFPGRLTPGPKGFDEVLRFPLKTYPLNDLAILDDPFDIAVAAIDLRSCGSLHDVLHRAFINQNLIFALLRVEPRTPQSSFAFRGPATVRRRAGTMVYNFFGDLHIPYPAGFLFPDPNLATGFSVRDGGSLDPYLWMWAMQNLTQRHQAKSSSGNRVTSTRGDVFSYHFTVTAEPAVRSQFEYENHTQQGSFRMHSLASIAFGSSGTDDQVDTVTFTCFGVWRKAGIEQVAQAVAQYSWSRIAPYVGIQIGPDISNVNTAVPAHTFDIPAELAQRQRTDPDRGYEDGAGGASPRSIASTATSRSHD